MSGRCRWLLRILAGFVGLGALAVVGFGAWLRLPTVEASPEEAISAFTRVMNGAAAEEDAAIAALAGAVEAAPEDGRARLWLALALLHRFLEKSEIRDAIRASRTFDQAVELNPDDPSAAGWRAFWRFQAARRGRGDPEARRAELWAAAEADPRFTPFLAAVSLAARPLSSGDPQRALAALEAIEDCGDGTSWTCRRSVLFPFGAAGFHATLGDLKLRVGDLEGARAQYAQALSSPGSERWPYRQAFEKWAEAAPERATRMSEGAVAEGSPVFFGTGNRACAMCHEAGE